MSETVLVGDSEISLELLERTHRRLRRELRYFKRRARLARPLGRRTKANGRREP